MSDRRPAQSVAMSFAERLAALAKRAPGLIEHLRTEEATKNALVMPFIAALGYDVFNPREVVPEFHADVGIKKGEKVDYAIKHDDAIVALVECKTAGTNLKEADMSQLLRYFHATGARIAVLTDGVRYRFYSDLDAANKMDARPFLELDLTDLRDEHVREVERLCKGTFDLERMLDAAGELKSLRELRQAIAEQFEDPGEELVRLFYKAVCPGRSFTAGVREPFMGLVKRALQQFVSERVNTRLRHALERETRAPEESQAAHAPPAEEANDGIETTEEEIEGFHIVKSIARQSVAPDRVVHRDTKSYMGILLDDNNRKPICRLRFNASQKYFGLLDAGKNETRHAIESLDDIYKFADQIREGRRAVRRVSGPALSAAHPRCASSAPQNVPAAAAGGSAAAISVRSRSSTGGGNGSRAVPPAATAAVTARR